MTKNRFSAVAPCDDGPVRQARDDGVFGTFCDGGEKQRRFLSIVSLGNIPHDCNIAFSLTLRPADDGNSRFFGVERTILAPVDQLAVPYLPRSNCAPHCFIKCR